MAQFTGVLIMVDISLAIVYSISHIQVLLPSVCLLIWLGVSLCEL